MNGDISPTVPLAFDIAWSAAIAVWVVLAVIAVWSIVRTRHDRAGGTVWWCVFVIAVPILGALVWFWPRTRT